MTRITTTTLPVTTKRSSSIMNSKTSKKRLSFHQIEIIELPLTLGDSPSVRDGPPVSCGWKPQMRVKVSLDIFEEHRPKRRPRNNLLLSRQCRERILLKHGVSQGAISQATMEAMQARQLNNTRTRVSQSQRSTRRERMQVPTASSLVEEFSW